MSLQRFARVPLLHVEDDMTETLEFAAYFDEPELNEAVSERYADAAHESSAARERFMTLLGERAEAAAGNPNLALKVAVGYTLVGMYSRALEFFPQAADTAVRYFYEAQAAHALGRLADALKLLQQAADKGWDRFDADLRRAAIQAESGDVAEAEKIVQQHAQDGPDRAPWHYVRGLLAERQDDREGAIEAYERARTLDPRHVPTLFRAARLYDLTGEDRTALALYDLLAAQPRAHVNALINAAVIYEDIGRYSEALNCLRRVLKAYPNHTRARLFLKDVESCQHMVIVERGEEQVDARKRLLDMPLSEFELSVRARNCLKKMNIRTLGELIQLSEAELLAYKNFGETSLNEIKTLLSKKGLRLGQSPDEIPAEGEAEPVAPAPPPLPPGQAAVLGKPVSEIELSVRARRCLQRLNVQTLGDLVHYTEQDLLSTRNFGETSLNEVKARLGEHGLKLAAKRHE